MEREEWDDDGDDFAQPPPAEDRLWRHPSEVAAALRQSSAPGSGVGPGTGGAVAAGPRLGVAMMSALGGALVVAGLWLATTTFGTSTEPPHRARELVALEPAVATEPIVVSTEAWVQTVTREVAQGVVGVTVERNGRLTTGSGVAYTIDGYILTSHRLVSDADQVTVTLSDGTRHTAELLGSDALSGLAVVKVEATDIPAAVLGLTRDPQVGDEVIVVDAHQPVIDATIATIAASDAQINVRELFRTDNDLSLHGLYQVDHSIGRAADGAALVDTTGAVIGITLDLGTRNGGYVVPIRFARMRVAQDIADTGAVRYAYMGITGRDLTAEQVQGLGIDGGAEIDTVIADGPAAAVGLRHGDIIVSLDDEPIWSMSDLILTLRTKAAMRSVQLGYVRDGELHRITITLELRDTDGL